jgi:hypothetical protein
VLTQPGAGASQIPFGAGDAANFTGRDYVGIADNPALGLTSGTIQFWFNARTVNGDQTLFAKASNGDPNGLTIGLDGNDLVAQFGNCEDCGVSLNSDQTVTANTWHQVTLTFGPQGTQLYLDGNLVGESMTAVSLVGNHDPIVLGASNATTQVGTSDPSRQRITNGFNGLMDEVAIFNGALSHANVRTSMTVGAQALITQFGNAGTINGSDTVTGIEHIAFADGTVAYVLGAGSNNLPVLSQAEAQSLGAGGRLVVLGDGSQTLTLAGTWTAKPAQTIGQTSFTPYTDGAASLLVMKGVPVTVAPSLVIPTLAAGPPSADTDLSPAQAKATALKPLATGAVVLEQVDPTQLISLIRNSQIPITLQPATPPAPSLVFDEATGTLMEMVPSSAGVAAALMQDGFGEEWLFVAPGALPTAPVRGPAGHA